MADVTSWQHVTQQGTMPLTAATIWGFPKSRVTLLGVPIRRKKVVGST